MGYFGITPSSYSKYKLKWPIFKGFHISLVLPSLEKTYPQYDFCILSVNDKISFDYCQTRVYIVCDDNGIILNEPKLG